MPCNPSTPEVKMERIMNSRPVWAKYQHPVKKQNNNNKKMFNLFMSVTFYLQRYGYLTDFVRNNKLESFQW
jgi:hypothetical protein